MDDFRQLRGNGHEKRHLVLIELAMCECQSRQHTQDAVVMDQRDAEKAAETFFPGFGRNAVALVGRRIRHNNQLAALPDQTHQALLLTYADLAYCCRVQSI